jgi:hypothetical protein
MPEAPERPLSVTLAATFVITFGLIAVLASLINAPRAGIPPFATSVSTVSLGAEVLCAIGMLRGNRFARTCWLVVDLVAFGLSFRSEGPSMRIAVALMTAALAYGLFNRDANQFFRSTGDASSRPKRATALQLLRMTAQASVLFIGKFPRLLVSALIARVATDELIRIARQLLWVWVPATSYQGGSAGQTLINLVASALEAVIAVPVVIAAARFIASGETSDRFVWNPRGWTRSVVWLVAAADVLTNLPTLFGRVTGQSLLAASLASGYFVSVALVYFICLRLQLLVPANAIDAGTANAKDCWRITGRNLMTVLLSTCGWFVPWTASFWFGNLHLLGPIFFAVWDVLFAVLSGCSAALLLIKLAGAGSTSPARSEA